LNKNEKLRPSPITAMQNDLFFKDKPLSKQGAFSDSDKKELVNRIKKCSEMDPLEKLFRRCIAKKVTGSNIE